MPAILVYLDNMANLSRDDIFKLARLARIDIQDSEVEEYAAHLSEILEYVEMLQAIDVEGLPPTNQVTGLTNVMRDDIIGDYGYQPRTLLENVPSVEDNHIKVKRMIG